MLWSRISPREKLDSGSAETAGRSRDNLRPGRRHPKHGQSAFVGPIGPETEQPVDAGEARRIGQNFRREALRALRLHQRGDECDRVVSERRRANRLLLEARGIAVGEIAIACSVRRRVPAAIERGRGVDPRIVAPKSGAEKLRPFGFTPSPTNCCATSGTASLPSGMNRASAWAAAPATFLIGPAMPALSCG